MDFQSFLENGIIADIANSLGKSVDEVGGMLNVMKDQAISEREKKQNQKEQMIKDLFREFNKSDEQYEIKSDNTRVSKNVSSVVNN